MRDRLARRARRQASTATQAIAEAESAAAEAAATADRADAEVEDAVSAAVEALRNRIWSGSADQPAPRSSDDEEVRSG